MLPRQDQADLHGVSGAELATSVSVLNTNDTMGIAEGKHVPPRVGELSHSDDGDLAEVPPAEVAVVRDFLDCSLCSAGGWLEEDLQRDSLLSSDDGFGDGFVGDCLAQRGPEAGCGDVCIGDGLLDSGPGVESRVVDDGMELALGGLRGKEVNLPW
ncbi:hypothetical protein Dimus_002144 [Dionaea muscipula]